MNLKPFGKSGFRASEVGMGTYYDPLWIATGFLGWRRGSKDKVRALQVGLDGGMNLIDTAEVYRSEPIVADAIKGRRRDEMFIATKVLPNHLHRDDLERSLDKSLRRLSLSYVDLYQIHWPNPRIPIAETMVAMEAMKDKGKLLNVGVSNFGVKELIEADEALPKSEIVSDQVDYSLANREVERELMPHCDANGIAIMAYFPLAHGRLSSSTRLRSICQKYSKTPSQVALNWLGSKPSVFPIPRASVASHVTEDLGASGWAMGDEYSAQLDAEFPA